ncbi:MAG TPA: CapA family protein [Pyrinomonadaceae bacterium]|nr:CapA family protein [Pyrinomonadaceae bacterium]HMP65829.1 CapA family protein [Pyrinomonadaceae bacterium]
MITGHLISIVIASTLMFSAGCQTAPMVSIEPSQFTETLPVPTPESEREGTGIVIAAVGDIMLGSPYLDETRMPPNDGADLLKDVAPILHAADIAFGNLEGVLVDSGESAKCKPVTPKKTPEPLEPEEKPKPIRCFSFRMPTRYGKHLKEAGFDILSLANNHSLDFGLTGIASSRRTLDALGIKHAGSDKLQYSTAYLDVNGLKVAFIGFAHNTVVPNVNDLVTARRLVTEADKTADIVVVSFHGGAEGTDAQHVPKRTEMYFGEKRGNLPLFSRTVIDAGADLVIGHGPHVLRGLEVYKGRLIAYSLGNFATYGWFRLEAETALTAILEVELGRDGAFIGGKIHAGRQVGRGIPVLDPDGTAIRKMRSLSNKDFPATAPKITDDGIIAPR